MVTRDGQGRWFVIDGQHTAYGAATHGLRRIPVLFVPMNALAEQADAFIGHNTARIAVSPLDLFHARIAAGDENTIAVHNILTHHNISVVRHLPSVNGAWQFNQTVAVGTLMKLYKRLGQARFARLIEFVAQCHFKPVRADHLNACEIILYGEHHHEYLPDEMINVIGSLNDAESMNHAQRIRSATDMNIHNALATHWRTQYRRQILLDGPVPMKASDEA